MKLWPAKQTGMELDVSRDAPTMSLDGYMSMLQNFVYNGTGYGFLGGGYSQTAPGQKQEFIGPVYRQLAELAYKGNAIVFACMNFRALSFSEVRFQYQQLNSGRPGKLFGDQSLGVLEEPWIGGTTGDLLTTMLNHVDLAGNAFVVKLDDSTLTCLRPDWVTIIIGNPNNPNADAWDSGSEVLGYVYAPGGYGPQAGYEIETFLPDQVAHFAPYKDPEARLRGMSPLTPLIREIMGDKAMTLHKLSFFENGATPNLMIKLDVPDLQQFKEWIQTFKEQHEGPQNAYKAMFLAAGADASVIGTDLRQLDYTKVQGAGEVRIANALGTHPSLIGLEEGLMGSSLNAGNYQSVRRLFADHTMRPLWRNVAGSLARIVPAPNSSARLWYDDRDVAFLKEDMKERADVMFVQAQSARQLVDAGFKPDDVIAAIEAEDMSLLEHSGLFSVQLQAANAPKQGLFTGTPVPNTGDGTPQAAIAQTQPGRSLEPANRDLELYGMRFLLEESYRAMSELAQSNLELAASIREQPTAIPAQISVKAPDVHIVNEVQTPTVTNQIDVQPTPVTIENQVDVAGPVVNVEPTPVTVENTVLPPVINVEPTTVTVPAPVVNVTVPDEDDGTKQIRIFRDEVGKIVGAEVTDG